MQKVLCWFVIGFSPTFVLCLAVMSWPIGGK